MLSSSGGEEFEISNNSTTTTKTRRTNSSLQRVSSSSSKKSFSSSTSSRTSSTTPNTNINTTTSRTMEEVWKDINLSTLSESTTTTGPPPPIRIRHQPTSSAANYRSMIFQDFLGRPFCNDPSPTTMVSTQAPATLYGPATGSSLPPPPVTALSLNSGPEFHFPDNSSTDPFRPNSHHHLQSTNPISNISSFTSPFESLGSSSNLFQSFGKKRFPNSSDNASGDRRHKRMIKNRESAARSRARKQESI